MNNSQLDANLYGINGNISRLEKEIEALKRENQKLTIKEREQDELLKKIMTALGNNGISIT